MLDLRADGMTMAALELSPPTFARNLTLGWMPQVIQAYAVRCTDNVGVTVTRDLQPQPVGLSEVRTVAETGTSRVPLTVVDMTTSNGARALNFFSGSPTISCWGLVSAGSSISLQLSITAQSLALWTHTLPSPNTANVIHITCVDGNLQVFTDTNKTSKQTSKQQANLKTFFPFLPSFLPSFHPFSLPFFFHSFFSSVLSLFLWFLFFVFLFSVYPARADCATYGSNV